MRFFNPIRSISKPQASKGRDLKNNTPGTPEILNDPRAGLVESAD